MAGKVTLSESSNETRVEWKINYFFIREDNLIISPDFILFKSKWLLQLHLGVILPFSDTENDSCEPLRMSLLTLNPTTKHRFEYRMGIQVCNGSEITTEKFDSVLNKGFGQNPQRLELISRKDFEISRNTLVTDNTLTVFCTVRLMSVTKPAEDISSLTPSTASDLSSSCLLFCDERDMAGEITLVDESKNETRIEWRINNFSNRKNYSIKSPDFVLFNSKWLLEIKQADEFIKSFSEPGIVSDSFFSMRPTVSSNLKDEYIEYVMGIQMSNGSQIRTEVIGAKILVRYCQELTERKIISRKDFEIASDILDSKSTLKVFCSVRLLYNNPPGDITLLDFKCPSYRSSYRSNISPEGKITLDKSKYETRIEWTINNFVMKQSGLTESPDFILFKSNWSLEIDTSEKYVYMRLQRDYHSTNDHCIEYRMGIQRSDGSEIITEKFESTLQPRFIKSLPKRELISRKDLESLCLRYTLTYGSTLKVFCIVRLLSDDKPVEKVQPPIESTQGIETSSESSKDVCLSKGIRTLCENLEDSYRSKRFTDVTIKVKDKEFFAHKTILSIRSEVFASMFEHDTSEKRSSVVDITDCDPHSFENFLLYLYTGKLDTVSPSNATSLFKTADKYGVEELRSECVQCMAREMTVGSFCDIFHLAVLHGESDLLATATGFFIRNASSILITKDWLTLLEHNTSLCNELLVKFAKSSSGLPRRHKLTPRKSKGIETSSESSKDVCLSKGIRTLCENMKDSYRSKRFTDVTIKLKDKEFLAHKTILSIRSEVFASMFEHDSSEKRSSVVDITDCDPHSFENFLLYLYTGKLDTVLYSNATSLFKIADKYGVEELRRECVQCMVREMTVGSFCDIFHLAVLHGESDLLATMTNFFIRNASAILITKEWLTLLEEHTLLCNELLVKFAKNNS